MKSSIKTTFIVTIFLFQLTTLFAQKENLKTYYLKGKITGIHIYTYYASEKFGELIKGSLKNEKHIIFNELGNVIEYKFTDLNNRSNETITYTYNEKGLLLESNNEVSRTIYRHDPKGNIVEKAIYNLDGSLKQKTKFAYDANEREIESLTNVYGNEVRITQKYDAVGNPISMTFYQRGFISGTATIKYDSKNLPVETIMTGNNKIKQVDKYTFDEKSNYVTKTTYEAVTHGNRLHYELSPKEIEERSIEYELTPEQQAEKLKREEEERLQKEAQLKVEQERIEKERIEAEAKRQAELAKQREEQEKKITEEKKNREYKVNGYYFTSKEEFEVWYNKGGSDYSLEVEKRQAEVEKSQAIKHIKSYSKDIESMDFQKEKNESVGSALGRGALVVATGTPVSGKDYTDENNKRQFILRRIDDSKDKPYYSEILDFVIVTNKDLNKEWTKNGKYFSDKAAFYEAYVSGDYKQILKGRKN